MRIAVVIPTLDEATCLEATLDRVRGDAAAIVVADCGSDDGTPRLARAAGVELVSGPELTSRARALNAGAARVLAGRSAEAVLFLHADTRPPADWAARIGGALADPRTVGGAFEFRLATEGHNAWTRAKLWTVMLVNRLRYRVTGRHFGDQGIFARLEAFEGVGGFPDWELLEDAEFSRRLSRLGRVRLIRAPMVTSPRRFLRHGVLRQLAADAAIAIGGRLGLRPRAISRWYRLEKQ